MLQSRLGRGPDRISRSAGGALSAARLWPTRSCTSEGDKTQIWKTSISEGEVQNSTTFGSRTGVNMKSLIIKAAKVYFAHRRALQATSCSQSGNRLFASCYPSGVVAYLAMHPAPAGRAGMPKPCTTGSATVAVCVYMMVRANLRQKTVVMLRQLCKVLSAPKTLSLTDS